MKKTTVAESTSQNTFPSVFSFLVEVTSCLILENKKRMKQSI